MKLLTLFRLFFAPLSAMQLFTFSMLALQTTPALKIQDSAPAICIVQPSNGLNLRTGPGSEYAIITLLPQNEEIIPKALSKEQQWLQSAWQSPISSEPPKVGWVLLNLENLQCNISTDKLATVSPPYAISNDVTASSSSDVDSFWIGFTPAPDELGEHAAFSGTILLPNVALISDTLAFENRMFFELRLDQLTTTIKSFNITIFKGDEDGEIVYHRSDDKPPFCAFPSDSGQCDHIWTFADTNYTWPRSDSGLVEPGNILIDPNSEYTAQLVIIDNEAHKGEWDLPMTIGEHFDYTASPATVTANWARTSHPLLNDNPNATLFVTQSWNPRSKSLPTSHSIGVWYSKKIGEWAVFNQARQEVLQPGTVFQVVLPADHKATFVHQATPTNINRSWTELNHPLANGHPDAILLVTQNWNPGGTGRTYNDHAIGVWYNIANERWAIFNQDDTPMPQGAAFNVLVAPNDATAFVQTTSIKNINATWTEIDHPFLNGNPNAILLVTQNFNPSRASGMHNNHPLAVWYNLKTARWAIVNQDNAAMEVGVAFNVLVANSYWKCPPC